MSVQSVVGSIDATMSSSGMAGSPGRHQVTAPPRPPSSETGGVSSDPRRTVDPVGNQSPIIWFGIKCGGRRSSYWRVRAGMAKPELFLEREGHGDSWHFSLHASGKWHMKLGRHKTITWDRPDELAPGYVRAVGIVQPVAVARREEPLPASAILVDVPPDADPIIFSVFFELPGAQMDSWPGKNAMGSVLIGRIPLAAGAGTCCVVAHPEQVPLNTGRIPRPTDNALRQMRKWAVDGVFGATIVGDWSDGAVAMVDLAGDPALVETIDAALGG